LVAVVTQPDRGKGRGQKIVPSPIKEFILQCGHHGISILQPERVKEETFQERLRTLLPDLFVVVAYGQILPKSLLGIPIHGAVNVHASLLPKYRGASPIAWALLKGEEVTGVTTMIMDEGMDTGDILLQAEIPIGGEETAEILQGKLAALGADLLGETIEKMKGGDLRFLRQDSSKATYAPLLKKLDGRIDWKRQAKEIDRQVRALNPWPGAFTKWEEQLLKICRGEIREGTPSGAAGAVIWVGSDFIEVKTGRDSFLIKEVQLEGKRRMNVRDFLSGHPLSVGTVFQ
jgi:methionyl-tRNA formyltransferase